MKPNPRVTMQNMLSLDEKASLEAIYLSHGVATDSLRRAPSVLADILDTFHAATGRVDVDAGLLLRYMFNRRKLKDWPRLGKRAKRINPADYQLTVEEVALLRYVYEQLDMPSDQLTFSTGSIRRLAAAFREATGKSVPGSYLVAFIVAKRKRGEWLCLRKGKRDFADIEQVARKYKSA